MKIELSKLLYPLIRIEAAQNVFMKECLRFMAEQQQKDFIELMNEINTKINNEIERLKDGYINIFNDSDLKK